MKLDNDTNREFNQNRRCQACALPICDDIIYSCMECDDFILHQTCAHIPRKKQHAIHPHPISLQVDSQEWCRACGRQSTGFMYVCHSLGCKFILDKYSSVSCLNCGECDFALCFSCATLPNKLRYKHDEHFLILSYNKDASGHFWCEICEKEENIKSKGIYMCSDCNVTLHSRVVNFDGTNFSILPNNHFTRRILTRCHNRCQQKIAFKKSEREILCSLHCAVRTKAHSKYSCSRWRPRGPGDRGAVAKITVSTHYKERGMDMKEDTSKTLEKATPILRPCFHRPLDLFFEQSDRNTRSHIVAYIIYLLLIKLLITIKFLV
ncbi:hypothetical protein YC2023_061262 [Brassica napus]